MTTDATTTTTNMKLAMPEGSMVSANDIPSGAAASTHRAPAPHTAIGDEPPPLAHKLPSHIPALDGIRGIAVLLVLFCHATQRPFDVEQANAIFSGHIDRMILSLARFSWTGVDLFFVLSGFLITGILFDAKGKEHFFRNFYARRTVRIFPLYYTCLLLYLVLVPMLPGVVTKGFGDITTSKIWYPMYMSNYSQSIAEQSGHAVDNVVHVSWSLSIEEQFYLCWPLVCFLFNRKTLLKICAGMFFGSMLLRVGLLMAGKSAWAMGFTPCRVDALAVGAAIALTARGPVGLRGLIKPALWVGPLSAVTLGALIVLMSKMDYHRGIGQSPGYVVCGTALVAMTYGSLLVLAAAAAKGTRTNWFFAHPILRTYGKYSYAIYLLHLPIIIWITNYVFMPTQLRLGGSMLPGLLILYAVTFTLSLGAAVISWNVLEKHCLKLKDYFPMEAGSSKAGPSAKPASAVQTQPAA